MGTAPSYMGIALHGIKARQVDKTWECCFLPQMERRRNLQIAGLFTAPARQRQQRRLLAPLLARDCTVDYLNQLATSITR